MIDAKSLKPALLGKVLPKRAFSELYDVTVSETKENLSRKDPTVLLRYTNAAAADGCRS